MPLFKVGQRVKLVEAVLDWGDIVLHAGEVGIVHAPGTNDTNVIFDDGISWWVSNTNLKALPTPKDRRKALKPVPETNREKIAVRLVRRVTKGDMKVTAFKVESEGAIGRRDVCGNECTWRTENKPHVGCKRFSDTKVANDFILRELSKIGLAKRCKKGEYAWGYLYRPLTPLVFSKVYTDSETEWTTTVLLKNASDVLFAPKIVDAFNALATANGNTSINVEGSGMHTAFLQGEGGYYPSTDKSTKEQVKMFNNFAKSMRPLLPALYLLGSSRMHSGKGITRSTSPRQPLVSNEDKYSAIAYRYGALEFRVFDTCYERRDQLLDNIVVMAQAVNKYWKPKYVKPNIKMDMSKPVYFGNSNCSNTRVNNLESLYCIKEHVVLLNEGLRCIKPPYMTVKEVKQQRAFTLTVRSVKDTLLDTSRVQGKYEKHLLQVEANRIVSEAEAFYRLVRELPYSNSNTKDMAAAVRKMHRRAKDASKRAYRPDPIEAFAYQEKFGMGFPLGEV